MLGRHLGGAIGEAGQAELRRGAIGGALVAGDVLVKGALLIIEGGVGLARAAGGGGVLRAPGELVGDFQPGLIRVHGDVRGQGDVPAGIPHGLLGCGAVLAVNQLLDVLFLPVGQGDGAAVGCVLAVHHELLEGHPVVDVEHEGVVAPGAVGGVFGGHFHGVGVAVLVGHIGNVHGEGAALVFSVDASALHRTCGIVGDDQAELLAVAVEVCKAPGEGEGVHFIGDVQGAGPGQLHHRGRGLDLDFGPTGVGFASGIVRGGDGDIVGLAIGVGNLVRGYQGGGLYILHAADHRVQRLALGALFGPACALVEIAGLIQREGEDGFHAVQVFHPGGVIPVLLGEVAGPQHGGGLAAPDRCGAQGLRHR